MGDAKPKWRGSRGWVALAVGLAAIGAGVAIASNMHRKAYEVTLTTGPRGTTRSQIAQRFAEAAAAEGIRVRLVETTVDTEAELARLNSGAVDFAFVSGAYPIERFAHVREVAPLYVEALHLLVKEELAPSATLSLGALQGKSVEVGPAGSTNAGLATAVMAFVGLAPGNAAGGRAFVARRNELQDFLKLLDRDDREALPDGIFALATLPSKLVQRLVHRHHYRLVPLPFAEAFSLAALITSDPSRDITSNLERRHVVETTIPPFTYQVDPPVPPEPMHTLGARLYLVAGDRLPPQVVERMLDAAFSPRFTQSVHPPLDRSVLALPPRLRLHPGRVRFALREMPIITHENVDVVNNTLGVLGALGGGAFFLWQWARQRRRDRRDGVFASYMLQVAAIERRVADLELAVTLDLDPLVDMQRELLRLKSEALDRFAAGEIGDQSTLSDLLQPINAARVHIGDLILHVRTNIEERADAEGKTAAALWTREMEKPEDPGGNS